MSILRYILTACIAAFLIGRMVSGREAVEFYLGNSLFDIGVVFTAVKTNDDTVTVWAMAVGITVVDYFSGWPRFWTFNADAR